MYNIVSYFLNNFLRELLSTSHDERRFFQNNTDWRKKKEIFLQIYVEITTFHLTLWNLLYSLSIFKILTRSKDLWCTSEKLLKKDEREEEEKELKKEEPRMCAAKRRSSLSIARNAFQFIESFAYMLRKAESCSVWRLLQKWMLNVARWKKHGHLVYCE